MNFLSSYLEYVKETEPPTLYHKWVSLSLIAGALQRKTFTWLAPDKVYPNFYIILVGPSGRCRKGTAMGIGRSLLSPLKVPIAPSALSGREAFFKFLGDHPTSFRNGDKRQTTQHALTAISPELQVLLKDKDINFLGALTDLFDCSPEPFRYYTIKREDPPIPNTWFNLLGATAPDWMTHMLPQVAIGGGLTSRCIFVVAHEKEKVIANPPQLSSTMKEELVQELKRIHQLSGEYKQTVAYQKAYGEWYEREEEKLKVKGNPLGMFFEGYYSRRGLFIRKLGMLLAAARGDGMELLKEDLTEAVALLEEVEIPMASVFAGKGKSKYSGLAIDILKYIKQQKNGRVRRSQILRFFDTDLDMSSLKEIEERLIYQKLIRVSTPKGDPDDSFWKFTP